MQTEKERILANWKAFSQAWLKIWRAFSLVPPNDKNELTVDVWGQVQHIPAAAWPYIVDRVRDLDRKPQNLAKTLKAFHSQWIENHTLPAAKKESGRKVEGPIGQRVLALKKSNPGLSAREALRKAIHEVGRINDAGY